MHWNFQ